MASLLGGGTGGPRVGSDGDSGQRRCRSGAPRVCRANHPEERRGNKAPAPCERSRGQAHSDWYVGECVMGHRILSAERIHGGFERRKRSSAPDLLVNPSKTDRNIGRACRSTMDGCPGARFNGCLIDAPVGAAERPATKAQRHEGAHPFIASQQTHHDRPESMVL